MRKNNLFKKGVYAFTTAAFFAIMGFSVDVNAQVKPGDISIDTNTMTMTVTTADKEVSVGYASAKNSVLTAPKSWDIYDNASGVITVDLSHLKAAKDNYIQVAGIETDAAAVTVKISAIDADMAKLKAVVDYSESNPKLSFTGKNGAAYTGALEYRSAGGSWADYNDSVDLSKYVDNGAVLYFRSKAQGSGAVASSPSAETLTLKNQDTVNVYASSASANYVLPGSETKVSIAKRANAPKISADFNKRTVTLPAGGYRIIDMTGNVTTTSRIEKIPKTGTKTVSEWLSYYGIEIQTDSDDGEDVTDGYFYINSNAFYNCISALDDDSLLKQSAISKWTSSKLATIRIKPYTQIKDITLAGDYFEDKVIEEKATDYTVPEFTDNNEKKAQSLSDLTDATGPVRIEARTKGTEKNGITTKPASKIARLDVSGFDKLETRASKAIGTFDTSKAITVETVSEADANGASVVADEKAVIECTAEVQKDKNDNVASVTYNFTNTSKDVYEVCLVESGSSAPSYTDKASVSKISAASSKGNGSGKLSVKAALDGYNIYIRKAGNKANGTFVTDFAPLGTVNINTK